MTLGLLFPLMLLSWDVAEMCSFLLASATPGGRQWTAGDDCCSQRTGMQENRLLFPVNAERQSFLSEVTVKT